MAQELLHARGCHQKKNTKKLICSTIGAPWILWRCVQPVGSLVPALWPSLCRHSTRSSRLSSHACSGPFEGLLFTRGCTHRRRQSSFLSNLLTLPGRPFILRMPPPILSPSQAVLRHGFESSAPSLTSMGQVPRLQLGRFSPLPLCPKLRCSSCFSSQLTWRPLPPRAPDGAGRPGPCPWKNWRVELRGSRFWSGAVIAARASPPGIAAQWCLVWPESPSDTPASPSVLWRQYPQ